MYHALCKVCVCVFLVPHTNNMKYFVYRWRKRSLKRLQTQIEITQQLYSRTGVWVLLCTPSTPPSPLPDESLIPLKWVWISISGSILEDYWSFIYKRNFKTLEGIFFKIPNYPRSWPSLLNLQCITYTDMPIPMAMVRNALQQLTLLAKKKPLLMVGNFYNLLEEMNIKSSVQIHQQCYWT